MVEYESLTYKNKFYSTLDLIEDEVIIGIDEAGRGPVIGPMVYAAYICKESELNKDLKDSKLLKVSQREILFKNLNNFAYYSVSPVSITSNMNNNILNLNEIAIHAIEILLTEINNKCKNVKRVVIDALGNSSKLESYLKSKFCFNFVIEPKADLNHKVVSGASIIAKVTRDSFFKDKNIGCGYPFDIDTKAWLKNNCNPVSGYPDCVRHSWQTIKNLLPSIEPSLKLKGKLKNFYL